MLLVGLTGGIGSGKSTVARMLADKGAFVCDADQLARAAIDPGTPGFGAVVRSFGESVTDREGGLDRAALARLVFADEVRRRELESIVHPVVRARIAEVVLAHRGTDDIVVIDSPLIVETGQEGAFDVLVVVSAPEQAQVERLVMERGMSEADVRARIGAQLPLEDKARVADVVLDNEGSLEELQPQVDRLWNELAARVTQTSSRG
jgi:dephospho-CoA kinase